MTEPHKSIHRKKEHFIGLAVNVVENLSVIGRVFDSESSHSSAAWIANHFACSGVGVYVEYADNAEKRKCQIPVNVQFDLAKKRNDQD